MSQHPRKRSRSSTLIVMVPATTLLVSACGGPNRVEQGVVYQDPAECTQQNPDSATQCQADYQEAVALHPTVAPKYVSKEECEADFGAERCEAAPERHSQGSFFMPMMMGYLAGQMFNGGGVAQPGRDSTIPPVRDREEQQGTGSAGAAASSARRGVASQPLYKARDDQRTFRTATNAPVAERSGPVAVPRDALQMRPGGVTRSGGFGATASRLSSSLGS